MERASDELWANRAQLCHTESSRTEDGVDKEL